MVTQPQSSNVVGKIFYGALFVLVLPALLVAWVTLLEPTLSWSLPAAPYFAGLLLLLGGGLIVSGMVDLYRYGHGLPMNAFPPDKLVTQGVYAWFANPIYVGAVLLWASGSLWFGSRAGFYLGTPLLAFMALSLLLGYERLAMARLFGEALEDYRPFFGLPQPTSNPVRWPQKIGLALWIFVPGFSALFFAGYAHCSTACAGSFSEISALSWGAWLLGLIWLLPFGYVLGRLLAATTQRHLRHWAIVGTVAMGLGLYLHFLFPATEDMQPPAWGYRLLLHTAVVVVALNYRLLWGGLQRWTERVANGRRDWLLANGRFRIISHALYSALSGAVAMAMAGYLLGNPLAALLFGVCALGGAALFARLLWGSASLVRPFGYWGGILGSLLATLLLFFLFDIPLLHVALVAVLAAPFAQAVGRLRCLSQGCCHGLVTDHKGLAIRVWQPQSRVVMLSGLEGEYLLNTPLFSLLFNLALGVLLWRLAFAFDLPMTLIVGLYFALTGIERFAEDAYRGEKQTRGGGALLENQWIALAALALGMCLAVIPSAAAPAPAGAFGVSYWLTVVAGSLIAAFALSMDFPKSAVSFSRLSG